jgi:hypothetical protein
MKDDQFISHTFEGHSKINLMSEKFDAGLCTAPYQFTPSQYINLLCICHMCSRYISS